MVKAEAQLYYREGTSDKEYQVTLETKGTKFVVNFAYGRRGGTLSTGTKTQKPVSEADAVKIFNKLVAEKEGKGYTKAEGGVTYQHTDKEQRKTGILPQLLNAIDEVDVEQYIQDDAYCAQPKHDGRRLMARVDESAPEERIVTGINRKGLSIGLPTDLSHDLEDAGWQTDEAPFTFDGEAIGSEYYVFDMLEHDGEDLRQKPYCVRNTRLEAFLKSFDHEHLHFVETAWSTAAKCALYTRLRAQGAEGIVFKRINAVYKVGRPNYGGDQVKFKFYSTASFVVGEINDKRSVSLRLLDARDGQLTNTGNVSIPPNKNIPPKNTIIEVRYLYAYPNSHHVYQPVYLGPRDDLDATDCLLGQLKYKEATEEDDEA